MGKVYGQFCGLARAAEVVGERWTLLIMRDLASGPARFSELRSGLPGLAATMLTARLRDLEEHGVVVRSRGGPAVNAAVYELSELGHDFLPALTALSLWGASRMSHPREGEQVTDRSLAAMLATARTARQVRPFSVEIRAGEAVAHAHVTGGGLDARPGATDADLGLAGPGLRALLAHSSRPAELLESGDLLAQGDPALLDRMVVAFHVPLAAVVSPAASPTK